MKVLVYGMSGSLLGGIETFLLNMNDHMSDNCIFDYIIQGDECIHKAVIEKKGGKIFYIPKLKSSPVNHLLQLAQIFKDNRKNADVAYFNQFSMVYPIPIWMASHYGYKIVLHAHNNGLQTNKWLYVMLHKFGKLLLGSKKYIRWTNSLESANCMFGKNKKAEIIYNAIEVKKYEFSPDERQRIRNELGIDDKLVVGFSGRLASPKNPLFLIDIFQKIHENKPDSVLLIAGDGDLRDAVEASIMRKQLGDCVILLGVRKDIEKIYSAMDVFVLPSLFEGLGIVLIEAQANGLPCVTSADVVPNITRLTEHIRYVSLQTSPSEWAKQINELVSLKYDRASDSELVNISSFNINNEAMRVENFFL